MTFPEHWQRRFMQMAEMVATWSKDPSTKFGAVIVSPCRKKIAVGYNGFPAGMLDDDRLNDRDQKYPRVIHAELNALLNAQFDVAGCHMFITHPPCQPCASAIIQKGIRTVYFPPIEEGGRWEGQQREAMGDMMCCGIERVFVDREASP